MKYQIVGSAGLGNILGIEEAVFGQNTKYNTGAVCQSLKAELLEIDRELFEEIFRKYDLIWKQVLEKSAQNYAAFIVQIKRMEKSNLKIIDTFKRETHVDENEMSYDALPSETQANTTE